MKIPFINLARQYQQNQECIDNAIQRVLQHGQYVMGPEVKELEQNLSDYLGVKHSITCANGTDAIALSLKALNLKRNDVVFVPSFTFAASAEAVAYCGGIPFFVDIDKNTYNLNPNSLKAAIVEAKQQSMRIVGVIAVDLFGLAADYTQINAIANENNMWVMSDCAQGFGSTHNGKKVCSCKDCIISTTSFFPAKPLGCYGDGGAVFTNNDELANLIISLHVHGQGKDRYDNVRIGQNSRLDTIQAAILIEKLKLFPNEVVLRNKIANRYNNVFKDLYKTPIIPNNDVCVWAQYTLSTLDNKPRESIVKEFNDRGIPTNIYYPIPLHKQTGYKHYPRANNMQCSETLANSVFSLPMSPYLTDKEIDLICNI